MHALEKQPLRLCRLKPNYKIRSVDTIDCQRRSINRLGIRSNRVRIVGFLYNEQPYVAERIVLTHVGSLAM